jgi:hypothetical protein
MDDLIYVIKELGADSLALEGDSWNRRMTPMSMLTDRIDEFVDNVVTKKQRRVRVRVRGVPL